VNEDIYEFAKSPVLNGIIGNDSLIKVNLSYTGRINDSSFDKEDAARVIISTTDGIDSLVNQSDGFYLSSLIAEPGKIYNCFVNIRDEFALASCDTIPPLPVLTEVVFNPFACVDQEGSTYPSVEISFANNPDISSYYEIKIWLFNYNVDEANLINITDPVLLNEGLPLPLFSNKLITSDKYAMTINYNSGSSYNNMPFIIELRAVSRNYYNYVRSKYIYELGRYPEFGDVAVPQSLYSNIENGYGIFAGYSNVFSDTINPLSYK
jgi:hypothetical protein